MAPPAPIQPPTRSRKHRLSFSPIREDGLAVCLLLLLLILPFGASQYAPPTSSTYQLERSCDGFDLIDTQAECDSAARELGLGDIDSLRAAWMLVTTDSVPLVTSNVPSREPTLLGSPNSWGGLCTAALTDTPTFECSWTSSARGCGPNDGAGYDVGTALCAASANAACDKTACLQACEAQAQAGCCQYRASSYMHSTDVTRCTFEPNQIAITSWTESQRRRQSPQSDTSLSPHQGCYYVGTTTSLAGTTSTFSTTPTLWFNTNQAADDVTYISVCKHLRSPSQSPWFFPSAGPTTEAPTETQTETPTTTPTEAPTETPTETPPTTINQAITFSK